MNFQLRILSLIVVLGISSIVFAQRPHLEIGGTLGFKDEFHYKPRFDANSKYTELHIWEAEVLMRVSKLKFGGELGLGFEKASNYFVRFYNNSTATEYLNLNRISVNVSAFYYFIKKAHFKWDLQIGARNYFNLNSRMHIPVEEPLKTWKLAGRATTNFTFKRVLFGVYYERDLRSDYSFKLKGANMGFRVGFLF